ncbi:hypothetical protein I553_1664 [Mycobacterium xenopi 4042]|uniref:Uncharacterized protein n=1 Tax=Mycobacterium xenopi 4042 TaxID=1299334 RepID=X8CG66_MYCXE|nr:hypothetical protein I553_1664 [Mycobacterium xenopi 4042]
MESISLTDLAAQKLAEARQTNSGRAAHTLHGGHTHELRQTVMALLAGRELSEHDSPARRRCRCCRAMCTSPPAPTPGTARPATTS